MSIYKRKKYKDKQQRGVSVNHSNITRRLGDTRPHSDSWKHDTVDYMDCLLGNVKVPRTGNGSTLFSILMAGGMVLVMVTINGVRNTGLEFLSQSHWLYPLVFCLSFTLRSLIGQRFIEPLSNKLINERFHGASRTIGKTIVRTCCMSPIMCALTTLLINGFENYWYVYLTTLPVTAPLAILVNYFFVGPAVKMIFINKISPALGIRILTDLRLNIATISRLMGF